MGCRFQCGGRCWGTIFVCAWLQQTVMATIYGTSLGGWLVLEPWITPSVFEHANLIKPDGSGIIKDEYTLCEILGEEDALSILQAHWDTWVTENDIKELASAGITHIRIPVGYWLVDITEDEPWVEGGWSELLRALGWIRDAGLLAMIDLHGAPGSQNGFDNSGRQGAIEWDLPDSSGARVNVERTVSVLDTLLTRLATAGFNDSSVVSMVELVNEPFFTVNETHVKEFYEQGYDVVHSKHGGSGLRTVIHDSFRFHSFKAFMNTQKHPNVTLDAHLYQAFAPELYWGSEQDHLKASCSQHMDLVEMVDQGMPVIVGEWSLAVTDCAKWLNGYEEGSRFEGTLEGYADEGMGPVAPEGSCENVNDWQRFGPRYKTWLRVFAETQMDAYEARATGGGAGGDKGEGGWFFWNFKTEGSPQWDLLMGLREGYIPKYVLPNPLTDRTSSCATLDAASDTIPPTPLVDEPIPVPKQGSNDGWGGRDGNLVAFLFFTASILFVFLLGKRLRDKGRRGQGPGFEEEDGRPRVAELSMRPATSFVFGAASRHQAHVKAARDATSGSWSATVAGIGGGGGAFPSSSDYYGVGGGEEEEETEREVRIREDGYTVL